MLGLSNRAQAAARSATATAGPRIGGHIARGVGRLFGGLNIWFWMIVGLPTLSAAVYYFAIASNLYLSEAQFTVRGPAKISSGMLSSMLGGSMEGSEDVQVVRSFILSRDAVQQLDRKKDLRAVLSRPEGDLLTRFPGMWFWHDNFEALYSAYSRFVTVTVDGTSGIATLLVKAYRPEDAQLIASALLADSEQLVNDLNERARQDSLATFQREVDAAQRRLIKLQGELTSYRVKANMLDPKAEATGPFNLLGQLNKEEAAAKAQLAEVLKNSPRSPQIGLLKTRLGSLDKLIGEERGKITGSDNSVATAMNQYEQLTFQREMEEKLLASAVASREQARLASQRQDIYLETIARPNLADYPLYPKRVASFATVAASSLLAYGIAWLLVAGVREHASA